ncbi:replication-associated protein [Bromus-associated circular DNA virus 1]|nr:replication-associated protein [Bromus-associated circular DNA virus 1]
MAQFVLSEAAVDDTDISDTEAELLLPPATVFDAVLKGFRLSAKRYLLTYAQCPEDPDDIFRQLDRKRAIARAVGCIELHADGNPHIHIAVEFAKKLNSVDTKYFDYAYDDTCESYHPNISPAQSWPKCINYCRGKNKTLTDASGIRGPKPDLFVQARACNGNKELWLQWLFEHNVQPTLGLEVWRSLHAPPAFQTFETLMEIREPIAATFDQRLLYLQLPDDFTKSVVIIGPSGSGKTVWAFNRMFERFGPGLSVGDIDDLKLFRPEQHSCIVFDEVRFGGDFQTGKGRFKLETQIALCDTARSRTIRCRHGNGFIAANTPRVFTCTGTLPFTQDYQIERRIHIINLYNDREISDLWPPTF